MITTLKKKNVLYYTLIINRICKSFEILEAYNLERSNSIFLAARLCKSGNFIAIPMFP